MRAAVSGRKQNSYAEPINRGPLPSFDPRPAARVAASIMKRAKAPHALIGRLAMWAYLSPEQQEFTKDLDLAVPAEWIAAVEGEIKKRKLAYRNLRIGGLSVRDGDLWLDFIDRRLYHAALFRERSKPRGGPAVPLRSAA